MQRSQLEGVRHSFLNAGLGAEETNQAISLFEFMIRCESAMVATRKAWQEAVKTGRGDMEVFERAVLMDILNRMLDAECDYLTVTARLRS